MSATTKPVTAAQKAQVAAAVESEPAIRIGHGELLRAIEANIKENSVSVQLPGGNVVRLPGLDSLALMGGLATLAALGILDWPVATVIGVGHLLAHQRHLRLLKDFGEALEEA